jgi:hypothetical protein
MLTKGVRCISDLGDHYGKCKEVVRNYFDADVVFTGDTVHFKHLEGFGYDNAKQRLQSLMDSLQGELLIAEVVVFMDDWYNFAECRIEHELCVNYSIPIVYLESGLY